MISRSQQKWSDKKVAFANKAIYLFMILIIIAVISVSPSSLLMHIFSWPMQILSNVVNPISTTSFIGYLIGKIVLLILFGSMIIACVSFLLIIFEIYKNRILTKESLSLVAAGLLMSILPFLKSLNNSQVEKLMTISLIVIPFSTLGLLTSNKAVIGSNRIVNYSVTFLISTYSFLSLIFAF